jgi:hypothetical protein
VRLKNHPIGQENGNQENKRVDPKNKQQEPAQEGQQ